MTTTLAPSGDLGPAAVTAAVVVTAAAVALLVVELVRGRAPRGAALAVLGTGLAATAALLGAVLRPATVEADGVSVGPRVVVVLDASRSMDLPAGRRTRGEVLAEVAKKLRERSGEARLAFVSMGRGPAEPVVDAALEPPDGHVRPRPAPESDLASANESVAASAEEPPSALVVVSDGQLDRPAVEHASAREALGLGALDVPVHTVMVTRDVPVDASVRRVSTAGAAVAHQPFSLRVEVGCTGGLPCEQVPVVARELRDRGEPEVLARGEAAVGRGGDLVATVELPITLHRAGPRVVEVAIEAPEGDALPDNDKRLLTLDVARDRVRVLHVAGRPTYDVRALRTWLKSDQSVDVVAFFILRTPTDDVGALPSELALIPFPVDELFSVHLPSFDAVVLQDFNAEIYGLTKHLDTLTRYVDGGGGLIMVGGPDAFGPGRYAGTPLAEALPVVLDASHEEKGVDLSWFTPELTRAGRLAPVLAPLRDVIGDTFPEMPGTNLVGRPNPGATVLLSHPTRKVGEEPMPVLALGEFGTGRTIALTVDGTHRLMFSSFAAEQAGRAYGALWDALLGWLMRDPRYESTAIDLPEGCLAGEKVPLVLRPLPGTEGRATLTVMRLGSGETAFETTEALAAEGQPTTFELPGLAPGGYAASVRIGSDASAPGRSLTPATRRDFACERGGDEWADPRPDPGRLEAIARATGGVSVDPGDVAAIPLPAATIVSTQRKTRPVLPPWGWTLAAAASVGAHWIVRRRSGLA